MRKIVISLGVFLGSLFLGIVLTSMVYAISWPSTPVGEFVRGGLVSFLEKSLTSTGTTSSGKVKKTIDTESLGTGTITVDTSGNIGIGVTPDSSKRLTVSGKIKSNSFNHTSPTLNGYVLMSDQNGNGVWQKNNYRNETSSLMVNGGTYGQMCYVLEDKTLQCLGYNGNGNLGISTNTNNYYYPMDVPLKGVKKVYSNNHNTYALMENGDMYFVGGYNGYGEGGIGTTTTTFLPQKITGISNVVDFVTSGGYYGADTNADGVIDTSRWAAYACALKDDGTVWCWGRNGTGQLGNGDTTNRSTPTQVFGLGNVKKVVMTDGQLRGTSCALLNDGSVKCWGRNARGTIGVGDTNDRYYPTTVPISNVTDIAIAGSNQSGMHACAVIADGTVKCWGRNGHGELGNGNTTTQTKPVTALGVSNVKKIYISKGSAYSNYALTNDGQVYVWGENSQGQLGLGDTTNRSTPVLSPNLSNIKDIVSTGWNPVTTCALTNDGNVKCFGDNTWGQLGTGNAVDGTVPRDVLGIDNVISIELYTTYRSNRIFACAIRNNGLAYCWGYNGFGQLGQDNNTVNYYAPSSVKNLNHD